MKKKLLLVVLTIVFVSCLALTACDILPAEQDKGWGNVFTYETAYAEAQSLGYTGTLQDFIDSIKGKDGIDGVGIKSVVVNEQGKLIVTLTNDFVVDCGSVKGTQGEKGETGEQGPKGDQGEQGIQGEKGDKGDTGATGEKGDKGDTGEAGADGTTPQLKVGEDNYWYVSYDNGETWTSLGVKATGEKGDKGETGAAGEKGEQGIQGEKGDTGATGDKGDKGEAGKDGTDGTTPQLKVGEDNYWYVSYDNGETWKSLGVKATGDKGDKGETGATGAQGPQGEKGDKGDQGIQGEKGDQGEQGIQGEKGDQGIQGDKGDKGDKGDTGAHVVSSVFDQDGNTVLTYSDGTTQTIEHKWQLSCTLVQANCLTNGKVLYECEDCSAVRVVTVAKSGHTEGKWVIDVEPNCTETGSKHQICSVCGDSYQDTVVPTNGVHSFHESTTCTYCKKDIADVAVDSYNMSKTDNDNVRIYVVPRADGKCDAYLKGTGATKDYSPHYDSNPNPFEVDGYTIANAYIQKGITTIGNNLFCECDLTSIAIPNSVTTIGDFAFSNCTGLTSVTFEKGSELTTIGNYAFENCTSLASVTFEENSKLTTIGNEAFRDCSSLASITIPSSVITIGDWAFSNSSNLTSITIKGSPKIGRGAFDDTAAYNNISNWENKVLYIGNCLIATKTTIESCTIKDGTKVIAGEAFSGCLNLTNITIPNSVTTIGYSAFRDCTSLASIIIPSSVTTIGDWAFFSCTSLESVTIPFVGTTVDGSSNISFKNIFDPASPLETVVITGGSSIPYGQFSYGEFSYYSSLRSITIPSSVTSIGVRAFESCSNLTNVTFEEGSKLTTIGEHAFGGTNLASITIPSGVTSIGRGAFFFCENLESITIPSSVTSIGDSAFYGCSWLWSVTFEEGSKLTTIGSSAFSNCTWLRSVTIPSSVTSIGNGAFSNCTSLANITIPFVGIGIHSGSISSGAPKTVVITGGSSIPSGAFSYCSDLASITIPNSVTSIGDRAFTHCLNLTSITFEEGSKLTTIGDNAFYECTWLASITIPSSVTTIGDWAFGNCSNLTSVTFEDPNGWYCTLTEGATSGTNLTLMVPTQNATYLKDTYLDYYWYKSTNE